MGRKDKEGKHLIDKIKRTRRRRGSPGDRRVGGGAGIHEEKKSKKLERQLLSDAKEEIMDWLKEIEDQLDDNKIYNEDNWDDWDDWDEYCDQCDQIAREIKEKEDAATD